MNSKILIFLLVFISVCSSAQSINFSNCRKDSHAGCNINKDRVYAAILSTQVDKDELIDKTKQYFIDEGLAEAKDFVVSNYNSSLSEYVIRFGLKKGMHYGKAFMGSKHLKTPVTLYFDAIFAFNELGQIKISFTNFSESSFIMVTKGKKELLFDYSEIEPEIQERQQNLYYAQTGFGKFQTLISNSERLNEELRNEMKTSISEEYDLLNAAVERGNAKWLSDEALVTYTFPELPKMSGPIAKLANKGNDTRNTESLKKLMDAGKLINVDNETWDNYFEKEFDNIFKEICQFVDGDLLAVALDGITKYENVNGVILPTDEKKRKKWRKKNIEY